MIKPIIACDIDDVKFPFIPKFCNFHNRVYGTRIRLSSRNFHTYQISDVLRTSVEESVKRIEEYLHSEEFLTAQPMEGTQDAIEHLSSDFRIISVTARRDCYMQVTNEWIAHFFPQIEEIHFSHNHYAYAGDRKTKAEICKEKNAQFLIEDSGDYALQVAESGTPVYLFDQPWNQGLEYENITRVFNNGKGHWSNLLNIVYKDI